MRVLILSPIASLGGAERVLLTAIDQLAERASPPRLRIIAFEPGPLLDEAGARGVETEVIAPPPCLAELGEQGPPRSVVMRSTVLLPRLLLATPSAMAFGLRLRAAIAGWRPTIVHSNGVKAHLLAALATSRSVRLFWHLHDFPRQRPVSGRLLQLLAHRTQGLVAVSHAVGVDARRLIGRRAPVHVVPNIVDVDHFQPGPGDPAVLGETTAAPHDPTLRIGLVATYARWKGHGVFLSAAAQLARDLPHRPLRFYVVGGPVYRTSGSQYSRRELDALARDVGVDARVSFVDTVADTAPVYRALDIVVHASTRPEPFGLTIAEAMASGRPVIVTRGGGAAEWGRPGEDHLAVEPGQPAALVRALHELVSNDELRRTLGANARRTAQSAFCKRRYRDALLAAYGVHPPV